MPGHNVSTKYFHSIVTRHSPICSSIHTLGFSCIGLPRYYQRLGLRHLWSNYVRVKRILSEASRSKISTTVFIIVKHKLEHGISEEALRRRAKGSAHRLNVRAPPWHLKPAAPDPPCLVRDSRWLRFPRHRPEDDEEGKLGLQVSWCHKSSQHRDNLYIFIIGFSGVCRRICFR